MDLFYKILLLISWWNLKSSVAMLQQATSSQSFVLHQTKPSPIDPSFQEERNGNQPKYEFKYEVSDQETGDRKSHWERRDGDHVRGVYTLYEPSGALRTVEYTADSVQGFNAVVRRDEPTRHQQSAVNSQRSHSSTHSGYIPSKQASSGYDHNKYPPISTTYSGSSESVDFNVNHGSNLKTYQTDNSQSY